MTDTAFLQLENGLVVSGKKFGYWPQDENVIVGEVVFQTGMVGYVESLTDPSYKNQILIATYPLIGNYGIPSETFDNYGIGENYESDKIHVKGFVVSEYDDVYSHWSSDLSLDEWLKLHKIPGLSGVDTRMLVKNIRENGTMCGGLCKLPNQDINYNHFKENNINLVDAVSTKYVKIYNQGGGIKILAIDCGIKNNQLRELLKRNTEIKLVPWNYDFGSDNFDRLFISNGPGNPEDCKELIQRLSNFIKVDQGKTPIMGVCMGHQILSLAIGANSYKMKYGNRGHNIPCLLKLGHQKTAFMTSQNHGYAMDIKNIDDNWKELFVNLNDNSNEGIYHQTLPYFSVQFHPEAKSGPEDTAFLFDYFVKGKSVKSLDQNQVPIKIMKRKKVLILGSGGLKIGQSGEFDYSGSQAIKAFKEEGLNVVLINPNIATVQTSSDFVDKVYFLPITKDFVKDVISRERPDCISLSFGGQTALNCGIELDRDGVLKEYDVEVLGTSVESIIKAEDRALFKEHIESIDEQVIPNKIVFNIKDGLKFAETNGYPILVRAAFALGGLGSGFANNSDELIDLLKTAFIHSEQVILDKSLKGWKEFEYEIVRDVYDNCVTTCNMENIDPLGVHTGESIVVAPSQTLTDQEHNKLRTAALKIVRTLGIVGECNIQYALDPNSSKYYVIELNPRLSRSSALASKATGYPLAYIAAKLSLGYALVDLKNNITKETSACFEPSLDYCVVKVPRWDLQKFPLVDKHIGTAMKSVGESMGIGRNFGEAFQKALRMANEYVDGFEPNLCEYNEDLLVNPRDNRIFSIATGLYNEVSIEHLYNLTMIDPWFLKKFNNIINLTKRLENETLDRELLLLAKKNGFSDKQIAKHIKSTELVVRKHRENMDIRGYIKQIDTVAGEFPCYTNYLYMTYNGVESDVLLKDKSNDSIIVLGSGVYKIGSSVEFDWCAVSCIRELKRSGETVVMINCNPETVSTDYDEVDRLYFEELNFETVMDIYQLELPKGIILSMGGQLPNNIAMPLYRQGVNVIGTSPEKVDHAENRYKFSRLLDSLSIDQPKWKDLSSIEDAIQFCKEVEYPCLVRPSYVLSGAAMNVAHSDQDLKIYLGNAAAISRDYPIVISKFIEDAKEIEVDAVSDNGFVKYLAISEHVENAGVHSGDATLILPPYDLTEETKNKIKKIVYKISKSLSITGPFNIQFIAKDDQVKVIECNLRVSRSFPFVSKTLGVNFIKEATRIMMGWKLDNFEFSTNKIGVKVSQFSFNRLKDADIKLGVEMLSTGEVGCFGNNIYEAFLKAILASNFKLPKNNILISIGTYKFKQEFKMSLHTLNRLGYKLYGTQGTTEYAQAHDIQMEELSYNQMHQMLENRKIDLCFIISKKNKLRVNTDEKSNGYLLRRKAIECDIPVATDIKFSKLIVNSLEYLSTKGNIVINDDIDSITSYRRLRLPGLIDAHVHVREPGATHKEDWTSCTMSAVSGGITMICAMPNTNPSIIDSDTLNLVNGIADEKSICDYGMILGASNSNYNDITKLSSVGVGLKMYLNTTFGTLKLGSMSTWAKHVQNWDDTISPICVHAEGQTLGAILHLGVLYHKRIHVCHISTREEIEIVKLAKMSGSKVTCEVAPHHLFLNTEDKIRLGIYAEVKPPLAEDDDTKALWENMEIIDCFATDHAPHKRDEKQSCGCPGFPGLETALPLLLTAVKNGRLTIDDIILRYHTNPKKIFNLPDQEDTFIEIDLDKKWTIKDTTKFSKAGWTPFAGMEVYGKVRNVVIRGKQVYVDGKFLIKPGFGKNVRTFKFEENKINKKETVLGKWEIDNKLGTEFKLKNVYSVNQFDRNMLRYLFRKADEMKTESSNLLEGKIIGNLFYEPSTRTRCSFSAAVQRLGGKVMDVSSTEASIQKGESIEDTIRCLETYCDGLVVRTTQKGSIKKALQVSKKPLINAGDGAGEHPTQTLVDLYTIREELGTITGMSIAIVGDLKNGRTVHSLVKMLVKYNARIRYISPKGLELPEEIYDFAKLCGIEQSYHDNLEDILDKVDVLYVTRIQKERFNNPAEYEKVKGSYIITPKTLTNAKDNMIVMHPLPRVDEISTELDDDPRSAYFRQMEYGLYIRMALMTVLF